MEPILIIIIATVLIISIGALLLQPKNKDARSQLPKRDLPEDFHKAISLLEQELYSVSCIKAARAVDSAYHQVVEGEVVKLDSKNTKQMIHDVYNQNLISADIKQDSLEAIEFRNQLTSSQQEGHQVDAKEANAYLAKIKRVLAALNYRGTVKRHQET